MKIEVGRGHKINKIPKKEPVSERIKITMGQNGVSMSSCGRKSELCMRGGLGVSG